MPSRLPSLPSRLYQHLAVSVKSALGRKRMAAGALGGWRVLGRSWFISGCSISMLAKKALWARRAVNNEQYGVI